MWDEEGVGGMKADGAGDEGLCLLTQEEPLAMGEEDVRRKEEERSRDGYTAALLPAEVQAVLTDPAWMCLLYDDVDSAFRTRAIHAEDVQRLCGQLLRAQESLRGVVVCWGKGCVCVYVCSCVCVCVRSWSVRVSVSYTRVHASTRLLAHEYTCG